MKNDKKGFITVYIPEESTQKEIEEIMIKAKIENDKYFVPNIEEFFIGYEYEELWENIPFGEKEELIQEWRIVKFGYSSDVYELSRTKQTLLGLYHSFVQNNGLVRKDIIRVPYLTKEQIEAEGWILVWNDGNDGIEQRNYIKNNWSLTFCIGYTGVVNNIVLLIGRHHFFDGECKSINEFRYICKLLKI